MHAASNYPLLVLLTGSVLLLALLLKAGLERLRLPAMVGYLLLGFGIRAAREGWGGLPPELFSIFGFLAKLGLVALLFRVGLDSKLRGLLAQLKRASLVWIGDVLISAGVGFAACRWLLELAVWPSALVAVAFTATSVGITVAVWQQAGALGSANGRLLTDLAELDDLSAVVLMALLLALLPALHAGGADGALLLALRTGGWVLLKLLAFGAGCLLFSLYLERRLTGLFQRLEPAPDPMLMVAGLGFVIAALAGLAGFSLAIGAFFAGVIFSRDPRAVKMEASFLPIHELLSPFFFIGIGLQIEPGALAAGLGDGGLLLAAAVVAKLLADGLLAMPLAGPRGGLLIGASMVPRAEIALVVMHQGLQLGPWAVSSQLFAAVTTAAAGTCLLGPIAVRLLLARWPQREQR